MVQKLIVPMQKMNKSFLWWPKVEASPKINVKQNTHTHTPCKNDDDIITIMVILNEFMNHHDSFACLQRYCLKYGYRLHPVPNPQKYSKLLRRSLLREAKRGPARQRSVGQFISEGYARRAISQNIAEQWNFKWFWIMSYDIMGAVHKSQPT